MMSMARDFWPLIAAVLACVVFRTARVGAAAAASARVAQLNEAAIHLERHAQALALFLDDKDAPPDLKRLLISLSDAMADQATVAMFAEWARTRPADAPVENPETEALLASLHAARPDLFEAFVTGIWTAVAGASLRWPANAAVDRILARMVSSPKRDVVIAVTATRFRSGIPFSVRASPAAAAA